MVRASYKISYEFLRTLKIWLIMRGGGLKFHKNKKCFLFSFSFLLFGKHDTKLMRISHAEYFKRRKLMKIVQNIKYILR